MVRCRTRATTLPCALAWLAISPRARVQAAAVSADDLLAFAGSDATGQVLTTAAYSLTMIANSTSCLISLSSETTQGELGWLGFGVGTQMAGADIV